MPLSSKLNWSVLEVTGRLLLFRAPSRDALSARGDEKNETLKRFSACRGPTQLDSAVSRPGLKEEGSRD